MVLPRQFLKVSALRPYFPGGELNTFASTLRIHVEYATPSSQRLLLGLLGYLIRFAPLAFVPHRQNRSSWTPSPQVVFLGLYHFTSSPKIPPAPTVSSLAVSPARRQVKHDDFTKDLQNRLRTL